jgi:hypothetical protein
LVIILASVISEDPVLAVASSAWVACWVDDSSRDPVTWPEGATAGTEGETAGTEGATAGTEGETAGTEGETAELKRR